MRFASRLLPALLCLSLLAFGSHVVAEDDVIYQPPDKKDAPPPTVDKKAPVPAFPSCITVTVAPGPVRQDGNIWDLGKSTAAPDIKIRELTTGASTQCAQTWTCSIVIHPVGRQISLKLSDDDLDADDPIGEGSCTIGKACTVGVAKVTTSKC